MTNDKISCMAESFGVSTEYIEENLDVFIELPQMEELMPEILTKDADNMLEVMDRTGERSDIWQDRLIYHMALAIYHILVYLNRKEKGDGKR